jgi:hypothetical protein
MNISIENLKIEAANLKSDGGENREYDRALVELVCYASGGTSEHLKTIAKDLDIPTDLWGD